MPISTVFFDLDDTLYPVSSGVWPLIAERIGLYMRERMGMPAEQAQSLRRQYFEQYGTTLRGLVVHHSVDVPDFLAFVHDVPVRDHLKPALGLRSVLAALPARKFIFTNADVNHANRVLAALELQDCFDGCVDVVALTPHCKPMPAAFDIALRLAGESDPRRCAMIDDLPRTTRAARQHGLFSILYGHSEPHPDADATLTDWARLPELLTNGRY
jgi:pyrimidine 5'-nucleotidase